MKNLKHFLAVVVIGFILGGCKREVYPTVEETTPVFKSSGLIDGTPLLLEAGVGGCYVNVVESQSDFGVYQYKTGFYNTNCTDCDPQLEIIFNDDEVTSPGIPGSLSLSADQEIGFMTFDNSSDYLTIHYHSETGPGTEVTWHFGDGEESEDSHPHHTYASAGSYEVMMEVEHEDGEENHDYKIIQTVRVGSIYRSAVPFKIVPQGFQNILCEVPMDLPPYLQATHWTVDGTDQSGESFIYNNNGPGWHEITLHYENIDNGTTGYYTVLFQETSYINELEQGFNYLWDASLLNLGNVIIRYRDASGNCYSTIHPANNNPEYKMQIEEITAYTETFENKPSNKVRASFNAILVNELNPTDQKSFTNFIITIPVHQ